MATKKQRQRAKETILLMTRRDVRYLCYRLRTEAEGISQAPPEAATLRDWYEAQEEFTSWLGFARAWDLGGEGQHHRVVRRLYTEEQLWNLKLASLARPLPITRK